MNALFVLASLSVVVFLMKCIYDSIARSSEASAEAEPPPPTLEETLTGLLGYFRDHLHEVAVYPDCVVLYCYRNSPQDSVTDYHEVKVRFCDLGYRSIPNDDCQALQDSLRSAMGLQSDA